MKRISLFLFCCIIICGCAKQPKETRQTDNPEVPVELLFEHDGYKIYRFYDDGRYHYYVTPIGSTITDQSAGKTTYPENVVTDSTKR